MITRNPISTISFNSIDHLIKCLNRLLETREINFYSFIEHLPEENEKKSHIHLYIVPNGQIDTDKLREEFFEFIDKNSLPLGVLPFMCSKFQDWYLYSQT